MEHFTVEDLIKLGFEYYEYGGGYTTEYRKDGVRVPIDFDYSDGESYIYPMHRFIRYMEEDEPHKIDTIDELKEFYFSKTGKEL